jgi:hypothetical protein
VIGYANSVNAPFVFDDYHNIIGNQSLQIEDLSLETLKKAAVEKPSRHRWIPKLTLALNYYFAKKTPISYHSMVETIGPGFTEPKVRGYHLVNILIHMAAGAALYFLFIYTLSSPVLANKVKYVNELALLGALLWVVHPVQTNAVTYVVQRMTSIAALFFFCSLLAYAIARRDETAGLQRYFWFFLSLVSGLLAMVSKENSAMLPVMIAGCLCGRICDAAGDNRRPLRGRQSFYKDAGRVCSKGFYPYGKTVDRAKGGFSVPVAPGLAAAFQA